MFGYLVIIRLQVVLHMAQFDESQVEVDESAIVNIMNIVNVCKGKQNIDLL